MEMKDKAQQGAMPVLEGLMHRLGLDEMQAAELLRGAAQHRAQVMERARQIVAAMEVIGDETFTPARLRANPEAMRAVEEGMSAGEIYRRYFLKQAPEMMQETKANLGAGGYMNGEMTPEEIERISEYVTRTGSTYEMD